MEVHTVQNWSPYGTEGEQLAQSHRSMRCIECASADLRPVVWIFDQDTDGIMEVNLCEECLRKALDMLLSEKAANG